MLVLVSSYYIKIIFIKITYLDNIIFIVFIRFIAAFNIDATINNRRLTIRIKESSQRDETEYVLYLELYIHRYLTISHFNFFYKLVYDVES